MKKENNKILLVCKETYGAPLILIAEILAVRGFEIALFFIQNNECCYRNGENKLTYFNAKKRLNITIYSVSNIHENLFKKELGNWKEDLAKLEEKYKFEKPYVKQLVTSQAASRPFHTRYYWPFADSDVVKKWYYLNFKTALSILDEFKPDFVYDLDTAEMQRTILYEILKNTEIPYIQIEHSRVDDYLLPTFCLGTKVDYYFSNIFETRQNAEYQAKAAVWIKEKRSQTSLLQEKFKGTFHEESTYTLMNLLLDLLKIFWQSYRSISIELIIFRLKWRSRPFFAPFLAKTYWVIEAKIKRFLIAKKIVHIYDEIDKKDRYFYMPLHLTPESTTSVKAPDYIEEIENVKNYAKCLRSNEFLYVKEHPMMIGERPLKFYRELHRIPNVKVIDPMLVSEANTELIKNAIGVITITGTSSFEAAILKKPSVVHGPVYFELMRSVQRRDDFSSNGDVLNWMRDFEFNHRCELDLIQYVASVMFVGTSIKLREMLRASMRQLKVSSGVTSPELKRELERLIRFYERAIALTQEESISKACERQL